MRPSLRPSSALCSRFQLKAQLSSDASGMFTGDQYLKQKQCVQRAEWAASVRSSTGSRKQQFWEPQLDPPALLADVVLVLVSPRRPVSLGTVARAASCFEVGCIRVVQPRCDYITRNSKGASKGAQYMMFQAQNHDTVAEATADCDLSVAFTRWVAARTNVYFGLPALLLHPAMQGLIRDPVAPSNGLPAMPLQEGLHQPLHAAAGSSADLRTTPSAAPAEQSGLAPLSRRRTRVALVFGREELGLSDEEVDTCSVACSIPIGRLQESLSLSHAVSIVLSQLYAERLAFVAGSGTAAAPCSSVATVGFEAVQQHESGYVVRSVHGLANGYASEEEQ